LHLEGSIVYDTLPYPGIGKLGFEWDSYSAAWEDRLSELADYRKIHGTAMFLQYSENTNWLMGRKPKESIQVALEGKNRMTTLPNPGIEDGF
jgi:hypothetical protein